MTLEENMEDRILAELAIEQVIGGGEPRQRFWEELIRQAKEHLPPEPQPVANLGEMSEQAAISFERVWFPRGQNQGKEVGLVDEEYIVWWAEKQEDSFTFNLKRYVKTERFKRRQAEHKPTRDLDIDPDWDQ